LIVLDDRKGKREEAFSFGGQLSIESGEEMTRCKLVSSAPIMKITNADPQHAYFIEELEIVLAQHRAKSADDDKFNKKLCSEEPFHLYLACLLDLVKKFENSSNHSERNLQMLIFLHHELHRLQAAGMIEDPSASLADIFGEV